MYRFLMALFLAVFCLSAAGCGDNHENVAQDSISQMKKVVNILENIETVDDAKQAKTKLKDLAVDLKAIEIRMNKLGRPDSDTDKKLKAKFEKDQKELAAKMSQLMDGLSPEIREELSSDIKDVASESKKDKSK